MTDKETMKMALEALEANYLLVNGTETHGGLEQCLDGYYSSCFDTDPINKQTEEAIAALKERLAQPADTTGQAPCARHCEATAFQIVIKNLRGDIERMKAAQPAQRTEQNFCPRCGKRTKDIHTCTPPKEKNDV